MLKNLFLLHLLSTYLFAIDIILYSECNNKPYSYCEKGEVKGINIEIYKAIFSKITDYHLAIRSIEWNEGLEKMKNKEIKMLGSLVYSPKERPFITEYTEAFMENNQALFCNKKTIKLNQDWPKDFYNFKIATIKGFLKNEALKEAVSQGSIEEVEFNSTNAFTALINNEVDCYIADELATKGKIAQLLQLEKDNNASLLKLKSIKKVLNLEKSGRHIGFSAAPFVLKTDLIKKINIAIKIMKNSQEIEKIINEELKSYLNPQKIKVINASVYNWGEYVSDRIPSYGVIAEIVEKAFANQNIQINYNFVHSNYAYLLTKWGESCVTLPWVETEEKQAYVYFSKSIKPSSTYLFYKKNIFKEGIKYNEFSDLKEYRIGGVKGYFYEKDFEDNNFNYTSYKNLKDAIKALLFNKIDLIPSTKDIFVSDITKYFPNEKEDLSFHKKSFMNVSTHVLFSKRCENSKTLRDTLNRGLENIKKDGTFKSVLDKYSINLEDFYDFMGDEVDSDNDGIFNEYDECSNTPEDTKIDNTGCERVISPYTMEVEYDKKGLAIKGYISSEEKRKDFIEELKNVYPNLSIVDQFEIEKGEAEGWIDFITTVIKLLIKVESASLKIVDKTLNLKADIKTSKGKKLFVTKLQLIEKKYQDKGYKITSNIVPLDKEFIICQNKFNTFLKQRKITFDLGTAIIKPENETLLTNLYKTAQSCPNAKIDIIGHTDSLGQDDANKKLSLERAKSVVDKLSEFGIKANRLNAIGKGESSPIAINSTKEGQEKNRRIEFKILGY